MHQLPLFVVSLVCLTEPPKYAGSNVSGGLCFDVRFPAGGVTDCRTRGGKRRGVDTRGSESRCLFTYRRADVAMVTGSATRSGAYAG